jgi:hypothetical protein
MRGWNDLPITRSYRSAPMKVHDIRTDGGAVARDDPKVVMPRLMRVSEVDRDCDPAATPACLLKWLREFIAQPHPNVGRAGSVCPFVPISLQLDTIWIAEVVADNLTIESISAIIVKYRNLFLETEPKHGREALNKAFLVAFPSLISRGAEGTSMIDEVQYRLKPYFVDGGTMLGEFHFANESPGLRNPAFRPLRSPVPMLAIRHMVESDLPFMTRERYTPKERSAFLRSYLFRLGGTLSESSFNAALDSLIAAQASVTAATAAGNEATQSSHDMPCNHLGGGQAVGTPC